MNNFEAKRRGEGAIKERWRERGGRKGNGWNGPPFPDGVSCNETALEQDTTANSLHVVINDSSKSRLGPNCEAVSDARPDGSGDRWCLYYTGARSPRTTAGRSIQLRLGSLKSKHEAGAGPVWFTSVQLSVSTKCLGDGTISSVNR